MSETPTGLSVVAGNGGLEAIDVETEIVSARIYLQGAHVTHWRPAHARHDVLWTSPDALFQKGTPIRGGIPLCLPWFGSGPGGDMKPSHGPARRRIWTLQGSSISDGVAHLHFNFQENGWSASLSMQIGEELDLELSTSNHSDHNLTLEEAFHTYFAVGDAEKVRVDGLEDADYFDKVTQEAETQAGAVTFGREVDNVYHSSGRVQLVDTKWARTISIEKRNSGSTVVWNPGPEKTRGISDLPIDGWKHFVCIETANVDGNSTVLVPGTTHTIGTRYAVTDI